MSNILHYRGNRVDSLMDHRWPMGPDMHQAWYAVISATYDHEKDQTTVSFKSGTYVDMLNLLEEE